VFLGDTVVTTVTVREVMPEKRRVVIHATSSVGEKTVLEGQATLMLDSRPRN
jgi:3-hydroxybutyryl-CoA dehydratase